MKNNRIRVDIWTSNRDKVERHAEQLGLSPQETVNLIIAEFFSKYVLVEKNELTTPRAAIVQELTPEIVIEPPNKNETDFNYADDF